MRGVPDMSTHNDIGPIWFSHMGVIGEGHIYEAGKMKRAEWRSIRTISEHPLICSIIN